MCLSVFCLPGRRTEVLPACVCGSSSRGQQLGAAREPWVPEDWGTLDSSVFTSRPPVTLDLSPGKEGRFCPLPGIWQRPEAGVASPL